MPMVMYPNSLSSLSSMITPLLHAYLYWRYVLESINPCTNHNKKLPLPPTHQIREHVVSHVSKVMTATLRELLTLSLSLFSIMGLGLGYFLIDAHHIFLFFFFLPYLERDSCHCPVMRALLRNSS